MYKKVITTQFNEIELEIFNLTDRRFQAEPIGRCDIKQTPIKEGDIIAVLGKLDWGGVVIYNNQACGFCFESEDIGTASFAHGWGESQESEPEEAWEILGSIY